MTPALPFPSPRRRHSLQRDERNRLSESSRFSTQCAEHTTRSARTDRRHIPHSTFRFIQTTLDTCIISLLLYVLPTTLPLYHQPRRHSYATSKNERLFFALSAFGFNSISRSRTPPIFSSQDCIQQPLLNLRRPRFILKRTQHRGVARFASGTNSIYECAFRSTHQLAHPRTRSTCCWK